MTLVNPPKALILLVALICVTVLLAIGKISTEAGLPIITAIVFYGIGNGVHSDDMVCRCWHIHRPNPNLWL